MTTSLLLLIQSVTFSHAGQWDCRAVFSDSTTSMVVNAGTLTVFGKYVCYSIPLFICQHLSGSLG